MSDKLRILFLITSMAGGGAERAFVQVLNRLDRSRFIPILALFRKEGPFLSLIHNDIPIYELTRCYGWQNALKLRKSLQCLFEQCLPDIVFSGLMGSNRNILRATIGCKTLPPIVICQQNNLSYRLDERFRSTLTRKLVRKELNFLYSRASRIVAVCEGVKRNLVEQHGLPSSQIIVIHNPVDVQNIEMRLKECDLIAKSKRNMKKNVIAVGSLSKQKGFADLIQSFGLLRKDMGAKLTIYGEGNLRAELERQIESLGLGDDIHLAGYTDDPWPKIRDSDLFVLSSHYEGFSLVLMEAMACGTAVLATNCDYGPKEILEDQLSGLLVPVGDVQAMSKAMLRLLTDDVLRATLRRHAKERVKQFDAGIVTNRYEELFESIFTSKNYAKKRMWVRKICF